jgi:hypothetical protein
MGKSLSGRFRAAAIRHHKGQAEQHKREDYQHGKTLGE